MLQQINEIKKATNAATRRDWTKLIRGLFNMAKKFNNTQMQYDSPTPTDEDLSQGDAEVVARYEALATSPPTRKRRAETNQTMANKRIARNGLHR